MKKKTYLILLLALYGYVFLFSNKVIANDVKVNIDKFISQGCISEKDIYQFFSSREITIGNVNIEDFVSDILKKYQQQNPSCPKIQKKRVLIDINFSNVSENDFLSSSYDYKHKFWFGDDKKLSDKYLIGKLNDNDLYALCSNVTASMVAYRICKEIYYRHHGVPNGSGTILEANKLTPKQLEEIAFEFCGKEKCVSEDEIKKHNDGSGSNGFCGSSGCHIGKYDFPYSDEWNKMLEMIKQ